MLRRVPSKEDIDKVIEVYHQHPIKGINLEMLKEARQRTCLGLSEIKKIIADYIENTYGTTLHKIKKEELICMEGFEKSEVRGEVIDDGDILRSQPYTPIFGTKYYWDVPYLVDVEKYKKAFKTEITEGYGGTLSLTSEIENGYQVVWAFSHKKKENERDWTSDCFQFHYDDINKFKEFVRSITDTFIGVDNVEVLRMCIDMENQITEINHKKEMLLNVSGNVNTCE